VKAEQARVTSVVRKRRLPWSSSSVIFVILGVLGIVALVFSDRRIAGMYLVGLILLLVADLRYRRHARTSAKENPVPSEIERP
jgi:hypothetical protein